MLMMLQNLDNAASAVVEDTSDYIAVPAPGTIGIASVDDSVSVAAQDDAVTVRTE